MPVINTAELDPSLASPYQQQIYCGLDTTITFEVLEALQSLFNEEPVVYRFEKALQAPALEMMLRGFRVDEFERQKGIAALKGQLSTLSETLNKMSFAIWGKPLNFRSHQQLTHFFYDSMHLPEIWVSKKGVKKRSMDREALEKLEVNFHAMPLISAILGCRELAKKLEFLETEVDPDGRIRTSYNIGGTETGRWSSSASVTGSGGNLQNWTDVLRKILCADTGHILIGIDLEQAESREVGWQCGVLFNDWTYYDACLAGDLHTTTAKLVWGDLDWSGDAKRDREVAERQFYRHFSYRDMSKRGGHGTNYYGTPFTMARHLKVPKSLMDNFQSKYFIAYPGIPKWHRWTAQQLQTTHRLSTPFHRQREFFGRPNDDTTLREAIAYVPQSSTADRLNLILWRLWKYMGSKIQLLAQVHDAVYFQVPISSNVNAIIEEALGYFPIDISYGTRKLLVPGEAKLGYNWGSHHEHSAKCPPNCGKLNMDGLRKWKKGMELPKKLRLIDRPL